MLRNNVPSCWGNTERNTGGFENKLFKAESNGRSVVHGTVCGSGEPESLRKTSARSALWWLGRCTKVSDGKMVPPICWSSWSIIQYPSWSGDLISWNEDTEKPWVNAAQRGSGCSTLGNIQDQARLGSEHLSCLLQEKWTRSLKDPSDSMILMITVRLHPYKQPTRTALHHFRRTSIRNPYRVPQCSIFQVFSGTWTFSGIQQR